MTPPGTAAYVAERLSAWFAERPGGFWLQKELIDRAEAEFIDLTRWYWTRPVVAAGLKGRKLEIDPGIFEECFVLEPGGEQ